MSATSTAKVITRSWCVVIGFQREHELGGKFVQGRKCTKLNYIHPYTTTALQLRLINNTNYHRRCCGSMLLQLKFLHDATSQITLHRYIPQTTGLFNFDNLKIRLIFQLQLSPYCIQNLKILHWIYIYRFTVKLFYKISY